jgi:hypothetical protein
MTTVRSMIVPTRAGAGTIPCTTRSDRGFSGGASSLAPIIRQSITSAGRDVGDRHVVSHDRIVPFEFRLSHADRAGARRWARGGKFAFHFTIGISSADRRSRPVCTLPDMTAAFEFGAPGADRRSRACTSAVCECGAR